MLPRVVRRSVLSIEERLGLCAGVKGRDSREGGRETERLAIGVSAPATPLRPYFRLI